VLVLVLFAVVDVPPASTQTLQANAVLAQALILQPSCAVTPKYCPGTTK